MKENARKTEIVKYKLNLIKKMLTTTHLYVKISLALVYSGCISYFLFGGNYMSTFMAKEGQIDRKWFVIDAEGKPLGRVATIVADLLRGKHKPIYTPHVDCGDHVVVINAEKIVLTGNKLEQKYYRRHSGYIGGLKEVKYATLMATRPEMAMELAVKGMVPSNTIGRHALTRLRVYAGNDHKQQAQMPEAWTL